MTKDNYTVQDILEELLEFEPVRNMYDELYSEPTNFRDFYNYVNKHKEEWQEVLDVSAPLLDSLWGYIDYDEEDKHYYYSGDNEDALLGIIMDDIKSNIYAQEVAYHMKRRK